MLDIIREVLGMKCTDVCNLLWNKFNNKINQCIWREIQDVAEQNTGNYTI